MTRATMIFLAGGTALMLSGAGNAAAQGHDDAPGFFAFYGGAQPQRQTISAERSFPLFDETATVTLSQRIRNGAVLKAGVGFPLRGRLGVGGAFSYFGRPGTAVLTATLPDPSFFDRPTTVTFETDDLKHTELGIHFNLIYQRPVSPKLGLTFLVGPSIIRVKQEIASVAVSNTGQTSVLNVSESGTALGANAGVDAVYALKPRLGLGLFVHYAAGKLDLSSVQGMTVGGAQAGVVLRVGL